MKQKIITQNAGKCKEHGDYHLDHGCGVAVWVGTSFAEHSISCPKGVNWDKKGGFFPKSNPGEYAPWEAPAGNCPGCWHNKEKKIPKAKYITKFKERAYKSVKGNPNAIKTKDGKIIELIPDN